MNARYYDSRASVWLSTDPLQEKYPNRTTYAFSSLNPVKYVDPNGMDDFLLGPDGEIKHDGAGNGGDDYDQLITTERDQYGNLRNCQ